MLFNQKYWKKFSRKAWLVNGDRSAKYFQPQANATRKWKLIIKIQDDCRIWIDDHKKIANKFILDYSQRIKSAHGHTRTLPNLELSEKNYRY